MDVVTKVSRIPRQGTICKASVLRCKLPNPGTRKRERPKKQRQQRELSWHLLHDRRLEMSIERFV